MKITGHKEGIQVCFLWNPGSGKQTKGWIINNDVLSVWKRERHLYEKHKWAQERTRERRQKETIHMWREMVPERKTVR